MKICLVQLTDYPEAGRIDIYEIHQSLLSLNIDATAIVCRLKNRDSKKNTVIATNLEPNLNPVNMLKFVIRSYKEILRNDYNIVHLYNPSPASFILGWLLRLTPKFKGKLIYDIRTVGIGPGLTGKIINYMIIFSNFSSGIVSISKSALKLAPNKKSVILPVGVNVNRFKSSATKTSSEFIYLGSLSSDRNLELMINAFARVSSNNNITLDIVGYGGNINELKGLIRKTRLESKIKYLGKVDYLDVPSLLQKYQFGLSYIPIVSWFEHQTPLKTLEYLSAGLITVATRTKANKLIWGDLPQGLLVGDSVKEFAEGINFAIKKRDKLTKELFRKQAISYDWNNLVKSKLVPFYRDLIKD